MSKFAMYGKLTANPGQREAILDILLESVLLLQDIEGCELYLINASEDDPDVIWVTELWQDEEAHTASLKNEGVLAIIQSCRHMIAGAEPIRLRLIGGKGI